VPEREARPEEGESIHIKKFRLASVLTRVVVVVVLAPACVEESEEAKMEVDGETKEDTLARLVQTVAEMQTRLDELARTVEGLVRGAGVT
jgi:hypothetical protein